MGYSTLQATKAERLDPRVERLLALILEARRARMNGNGDHKQAAAVPGLEPVPDNGQD